MSVKCGDSLNSLKQLVLKFEAKETELTDVPKKIIDEFGFACLANSLMFKEPEIPKHNEEEISEYFKTHTFNTLDSLINYIKSLDDDIDKLFAIFSYAALNIQYDTEAYFSDNIKGTTLEEVFQTKKAVCSGYSIFFEGLAQKVNLNTGRIIVKEYSNYAKGYGYDPLNPPKEAKSNHASVYVTIDGVPFICEPTWAAGHISDNKQFEWNYDPKLFLIPIYKSLCDHYPCEESRKLLPFKFSYEDFLHSCRVNPFKIGLKTESNPYDNFECKNGFVEQIYSCNGPIDWISFNVYKKNANQFTQIETDGITSYEIIQPKIPKHPERCRFRTNISFPEKGLYKVNLYIDGPCALTYYVNNLVKSSISVPILCNPFHDSKFIPISPKRILSSVRHGVALIRFAVSPKRSNLLWDIIKLSDQNSLDKNGETINRSQGRYIKLNIPFDNERYEDQLCVTFPSNGRYMVLIYLANDIGSFTAYTKYFFDVTGVQSNNQIPVNPVNFMFNGRAFAPKQIVDGNENEVIIQPNQSCFLVDEREQSIRIKTFSPSDKIYLELKSESSSVAWPKEEEEQDDEFRQFKWTIPNDYGEYHLYGWINDKFSIDLTYIYRNEFLRDPSQTEKQLLGELKRKIDLDDSKIEERRRSKNKRSTDEGNKSSKDSEYDGKMSTKCCLLL
ncbi:hypothetical protein M9Y10_012234 [Tritrichomonas musculus]|uniref:Transglutaminase-like domain-containing protein n=1 Tax=Tritrichomonas musculus TaxID=1915356 RepID=A0ABR2ID42_9EUKA